MFITVSLFHSWVSQSVCLLSSQPPLLSVHCWCHYSLTLWHPLVSCWRCVSLARRRWELFSQTQTSTCCTWCTRQWVSASTCRTGMELWAMERRSFSHTGIIICKGSVRRQWCNYNRSVCCTAVLLSESPCTESLKKDWIAEGFAVHQ